jgi:hypothetical protein
MRYDWVPIVKRRPLRRPDGKRLAVIGRHEGVWWATREEIADWYLANHKSHID